MNCKEVLSKINEYIEGTLPSSEREAMTSHFAACKACHNVLKERLAILKAMPLLAEIEPPPGFRASVMSAVRQEASQYPTLSRWSRFTRVWHPVRLAAAVLVLFLTIGYNVYPLFTAAQSQSEVAQPEMAIESMPPLKAVDDAAQKEAVEQTDQVAIMSQGKQLQPAEEMLARAGVNRDNLPKRIIVTTLGAGIAAVLAYTSRRKELN